MRRKGMTSKEVLLLCVIFGGLAFVFFPFGHWRSNRHYRNRHNCQSNLKQIAIAVRQYQDDNNDYFPSLRAISGWREAISPYIKKDEIFHCPSEGDDKTPKYSDYWFNARLSEVKAEKLNNPANVFLFGDGYASGDPRTSISQLSQSWRDDEQSPAQRHLGGANYAFADGHVKFLRNEKVTVKPPDGLDYSFAVR